MKPKKVLIAALLIPSLLANQNVSYADTLVEENSTQVIKESTNDEETTYENTEKLEPTENNKEVNITNPTPSEEEVKEYWHNYESKSENKENYNGVELSNQEDIYEVKPDLKTKEKGSLKQNIIDDTIHILNTFRYSMGLDPVEEDKELSKKAQAGAFLNYANKEINHNPKTPESFSDEDQIVKDGKLANSESNLAQGYSIYDSISAYMNDEDIDNNQIIGHRKWLMNPFLKRVGIGQVGNFNNIYVADDSAMSFNNDNIVTYPTKVNFTEFINPIAPFSVNLGRDYKIENIDNVKVVVTDKNGNTKTYTKDNGLFYSKSSHGNSTALIFGNELSKEKGSEYNIKVIGLKANEKDLPIEYTSKFISVNNKKKVVIPAKEIEDIAKPIEKPSIPWTEIEDIAKPIEEEKPSIPWTEIEDIAKPIEKEEDNKDDQKEDEKIVIPWEKIENIAKPIEKEDHKDNSKIDDKKDSKDNLDDNKISKEDSPSKDPKDPKDKKESKKQPKEKSKTLENKEIQTKDGKTSETKPISNVQTGVAGIGSVLTTLSTAAIALFKSKRK